MREVDDETPQNPEDAARLRDAADKAWAAFLVTPAWQQIKVMFERQRRLNIREGAKLGLSGEDRSVLAGMQFVIEQFLSAPDKALQRLRMQAAASDATETSTGEP